MRNSLYSNRLLSICVHKPTDCIVDSTCFQNLWPDSTDSANGAFQSNAVIENLIHEKKVKMCLLVVLYRRNICSTYGAVFLVKFLIEIFRQNL